MSEKPVTHLKLTPAPHNGVGREEEFKKLNMMWVQKGKKGMTSDEGVVCTFAAQVLLTAALAGLLDQLPDDPAEASQGRLGAAHEVSWGSSSL